MSQVRTTLSRLAFIAVFGASLAGCGNADGQATNEAAAPAVRSYTDYMKHQVELPANPERVIFIGETTSDMIALKTEPVGVPKNWAEGTVYEERMKNADDISFPVNLEKALSLKPDLIITGNTDEKEYEQLTKIAPTIMFDTFAPLEDRIPLLGDILGKKQEAEQWLADYKAQAEAMWKSLAESGMKPGETATVLTYYPGDRLFVMAKTGLSQVLYQPDGLKPTAQVQSVLDENVGFKQISMEVLPEFVGDRVFILTPVDSEAKQSTTDMMQSQIWKNLPAVQNGHVYTIDILKSGSDALSREWLIQELPKLLAK
ncbi:ABC transporter substrate-binding protein [Paenibacillus guangzhouensis]|uniref:ABC transporter substrate-binding protein n=1 Tax=Paenibacillus guangzhouensis TaxID=1473112 RepID=UPI003899453C